MPENNNVCFTPLLKQAELSLKFILSLMILKQGSFNLYFLNKFNTKQISNFLWYRPTFLI